MKLWKSIWTRVTHLRKSASKCDIKNEDPQEHIYIGPYFVVSRGVDVQEVVYSGKCPQGHIHEFNLEKERYCSICGSQLILQEESYLRTELFEDVLKSLPEEYLYLFAIVDVDTMANKYVILPCYGEKDFNIFQEEYAADYIVDLMAVDVTAIRSDCAQEYAEFMSILKDQGREIEIKFGAVGYTVST
jgi:hypothetical protein